MGECCSMLMLRCLRPNCHASNAEPGLAVVVDFAGDPWWQCLVVQSVQG